MEKNGGRVQISKKNKQTKKCEFPILHTTSGMQKRVYIPGLRGLIIKHMKGIFGGI